MQFSTEVLIEIHGVREDVLEKTRCIYNVIFCWVIDETLMRYTQLVNEECSILSWTRQTNTAIARILECFFISQFYTIPY
jgi:hypothetical protein